MRQMQKMGPLKNVLGMLPGMNPAMLQAAKVDDKKLKHVEAIVLSMTPKERANPDLINGQRRLRIAKGSGRTVQEVNTLLSAVQADAEVHEDRGEDRRHRSEAARSAAAVSPGNPALTGTDMATRIRLRRVGRKKLPLYRIVVADQESPRDGRFIEIIGTYNPKGADRRGQGPGRRGEGAAVDRARAPRRRTRCSRCSSRPGCSRPPTA